MTSPFATLFLALQSRITEQVPDIRFIDQDWNQLDFDPPPVSYPCLLIDFSETAFTQMQGSQDGTFILRLKLIYRSFTATSNITPVANRQDALEFYELEHKLYLALQSWTNSSALVNALIRKSAATDKRDDGLRVRVIDFEGTFNDSSVTG